MKPFTAPAALFRTTARRVSRIGQELIVDNFAGGGGASLGIELATGRAVDLSINHDADAVAMHAVNHPASRHLCESVWQVDPVAICKGRPVGLAWFSPDCRHFSRAKGGKPVKKNVRGLAWIVVKWAKLVKPRLIILENVREFQDWGPLTTDNIPCPDRKGQTFRRWWRQLELLGYKVDKNILDAADYGAPTHRRRLFVVARRDGQAIVWPTKTHAAKASRKLGLKKYRTAAECIDWSIPCPSIFDRKRPLAEKTLRRIAMGLKRYVLEAARPFIVKINHGGEHFRGQSIERPLSTITGSHGHALVTPFIAGVGGRSGQSPATSGDAPIGTVTGKNDRAVVAPYLIGVGGPGYSGKPAPIDQPIGSVMTENHRAIVAPTLIQTGYGEREGQSPRALDLQKPLGTVVGSEKHALVSALITKHYGGVVGHDPSRPIGTITSVDHHSVTAAFLNKFRFDSDGAAVDAPLPTITAGGNGDGRPAGAAHAMGVTAANMISFHNGKGPQWSSADEPLGTITSQGLKFGLVYAFLTKYFGCGTGQPVTSPLHTVTSRDRFGLVQIEVAPGKHETVVALEIEGVGPCVITDIGMRMLSPRELLAAQFSPELAKDYILTGSKSNQVHKIGNSVAPLVAKAIVTANYADAAQERAA